MLKLLINSLNKLFKTPSIHENLEKYIEERHPQTYEDLDRLEREFYRRKTAITTFPFYHE